MPTPNNVIFGMMPMENHLHDAAYYLDCALNGDLQDSTRQMFLDIYEDYLRMATNDIFRNRFNDPHTFLN